MIGANWHLSHLENSLFYKYQIFWQFSYINAIGREYEKLQGLYVKTNYYFMSDNNRIDSGQWVLVYGLYRNHAFTNVLTETRPTALQWKYRYEFGIKRWKKHICIIQWLILKQVQIFAHSNHLGTLSLAIKQKITSSVKELSKVWRM